VGYRLSPDKSLATLPLALQMLASMLTSIPASLLMQRIGRRAGFLLGNVIGLAGAALAAWAIVHENFAVFAVAAALSGMLAGFGSYYRFAAADAAAEEYKSRAISFVLAGGVVAAIVGPNLANWTSDWLPALFAGSYLALAGITALAFVTLLFLDIPPPSVAVQHGGRGLGELARQPAFVVAILGGALGYAVMALVMTATPIAMHEHAHHFGDTAFVIEWHVLGMFAPSFFTGHLIRRFGVLNIMLTGVMLDAVCVAVNLSGTSVNHFWLALTLLGVGWNFLFIGATTLLTETYAPTEKGRAQALNDFLVFSAATAGVLSAGGLQHHFGWQTVNYGVVPLIAIMGIALLLLAGSRRRAAAVTP
jgi:MFS family permease